MNWLDIYVIACIVIGIIHGLITGIVKQIISLVALVAAILLSGTVANRLRHWIQPYIQNDNGWLSHDVQNALYYVAAFVLIILLFAIIANLADKIINHTPAGILNRLFGSVFGTFLWMLCLSILLNFLSVFDAQSRIIPKTVKENSVCYERVRMLFPTIFPYINDFFTQSNVRQFP